RHAAGVHRHARRPRHAARAADCVHRLIHRALQPRRARLLPRHRCRSLDPAYRRAVLGPGVRPRHLAVTGARMKFRYYWEDFPPGKVIEHGSRALSEEEIIAFAREWDPQRFHIDREAAKSTPYGGIIASAWHTGSVMMRMMCDAYLNESSCIGS